MSRYVLSRHRVKSRGDSEMSESNHISDPRLFRDFAERIIELC